MTSLRARSGIAGLGAAAFMLAVYFVPPGLPAGIDYLSLHGFNKHYLTDAVRHGRLPLWNPHVGLGRPFLADLETATLYPPSLLYPLLGVDTGLVANMLLHGVLAALGMLWLCRRLGIVPGIDVAAALAFLASGPLVGRLLVGQLQFGEALCYLPLAFLLALRLQDEPAWGRAAQLALCLSLQLLAGHPQAAWVTWFGLGLLIVGRTGGRMPDRLRGLGLDLLLIVGVLVWTFALAAVALLPFVELVGQGNRAVPSLAFASSFALPPQGVLGLFFAPDVSFPQGWEDNLYPGLVFGLAGLAAILGPRGREGRAFALVALVPLLLALGESTPLFALAYRLLPGLSVFRIPSRMAVLSVFALILLGAQWLSAPPAPARRLFALAVSGAGAVAGLVWLAAAIRSPTSWLLLHGLLLAGTAAVLVAWRVWGGAGQVRLAVLAATLAAADLGLAVVGWRNLYAFQGIPPVEVVVAKVLAPFAGPVANGVPPRASIPPQLARENAGMEHGYSTYAGYVALSLDRVWTFIHLSRGIALPTNNTFPAPEVYRGGPFPYDSMSLVLGYDAATRQLAVRRETDPRVFVCPEARPVASWRDAAGMVAAGHDLHRVALVEPEVAAVLPPRLALGRAAIARFEPERVVVEGESAGDGLLVLSEAWYPGWRAVVRAGSSERTVDCLPVNAWMRGVVVPPGKWEVTFFYRSRYLPLGAGVTFGAVVLLGWGLRRRRALTPRGAAPMMKGRHETEAPRFAA